MAKNFPKTLNSRAIAAKLLVPVINDSGNFSDNAENQTKLSDQDSAFIKQLCYGTLRWLPRLNLVLDELISKPFKAKDSDIKALLLIGIYQLYYLETTDYAATSASVDACNQLQKSWAKGVINAVLRNAVRQREAIAEKLKDNVDYQSAHPKWLYNYWKKHWPEQLDEMVEANNQQPPMSLRCVDREQTASQLDALDIGYQLNEHCPTALTLDKPTAVFQLPDFDSGKISVQDSSAQWAAPLLNCEPNHRVLDACAAPGGKAIHCLQLQPSIELVALDISEQRLKYVEENIQRTNVRDESQVTLISSSILDYQSEQQFDRILLDAPCSGTGVIRRHPDIKTLRRYSDIQQFSDQQWAMLNHCWSLLKSGGIMLYCTCSVMPEENSLLIEKFMHQFPDCSELPIDSRCGIAQNFGRQILPRPNTGDGFFYAQLIKK